MKVSPSGIKARIDTILSQHLVPQSCVKKPPLSSHVFQSIEFFIQSIRSRSVSIKYKLQLIQHILKTLHEESSKHLGKLPIGDLLIWRRAWSYEVLCKELGRLNFSSLSSNTYLYLPVEATHPSQEKRFLLAKHLLITKQRLWVGPKKTLNYLLCLPKEKTLSLPPICIFPGTNFKKLSSILASSDPKGPGKSLYLFCKKDLETLLKSLKKPRLMGYSQGACMVQRMALEFPHLLLKDLHSPHLSFNAPGIEDDLFQTHSNTGFLVPLSQYTSFADPVSKMGRLLPEVYEINPQNHKDSGYPWKHHIGCKSYRASATMGRINIDRENACHLRNKVQKWANFLSLYQDKFKKLPVIGRLFQKVFSLSPKA